MVAPSPQREASSYALSVFSERNGQYKKKKRKLKKIVTYQNHLIKMDGAPLETPPCPPSVS
jgi:hypothetical protein